MKSKVVISRHELEIMRSSANIIVKETQEIEYLLYKKDYDINQIEIHEKNISLLKRILLRCRM